MDRRTNTVVITGLVGVVLVIVAAAMWLGQPEPHPISQPPPPPLSVTSPIPGSGTAASATDTTTVAGLLPARPPIPAAGVEAITPRPHTPVEPGSVPVVDPPVGEPTSADLETPEGAMRAWLARICPFRFTDPVGAAEQRARPAMTDAGWDTINPLHDDRARASWAMTVAARESGRCAEPVATISPEAPRSDTSVIVVGTVARVVTAEATAAYGEHLSEVRLVRRGGDGLWRVDLATAGG